MSGELTDFNALVSIFHSNTQTINTLWGFFYAIALALLGFVYKDENLRKNWIVLVILSFGFFAFAFGNNSAISRSQKILVEINTQFHNDCFLKQISKPAIVSVLKSFEAKSVNAIQLAHSLFTLVVIIGLWAPYIKSKSISTIQKKEG